jgi:tRNA A-37 threonylcarbamoyl transferase component Bud32
MIQATLRPVPAPSLTPAPDAVRFSVGSLLCVCRPDLEQGLRALYDTGRWVYDALRGHPGAAFLQGRRPVVVADISGVLVVVKRLHHGGALAPVTGDRFMTPSRLRTHRRVAGWLRARGVPTPEVLFTSWRRDGAFVRGEIGTGHVAGARDASDILFGDPGRLPDGWETVVDAVASMTATLHVLGVVHHDLNLKNFLVTGPRDVLILDVDKVTCTGSELREPVRRRNLGRLERSVRKQGRGAPSEQVERVVARLHAGYGRARASL